MKAWNDLGIQQWRLRKDFSANGSLPDSARDDLPGPSSHAITESTPDSLATDSPLADVNVLDTSLELNVAVQQSPFHDMDWRGLQATIENQSLCQSCGTRNSILGSGEPQADWVFVVDAPTANDVQNDQLVSGRAGQLFEAMLHALKLDRARVYTTSVFKCAPTDDLSITPSCSLLLQRQLELIKPKVVVTFGEFAAQTVIRSNDSLRELRRSPQQCYSTQVRIVPTYSPAQMLDDPTLKARAWSDLKKCLEIVNA